MIRVAAIGHGDIARRRHFVQLAELGQRARLVAITGRNATGLEATARQFGIDAWYTEVDEMLARDDIDAVLVLTPPDSHGDLALAAVEAGKHVLVEKPLVMSLESANDLLRAVQAQRERAPRTFYPLPMVDTAEHRLVAQLIADGTIGQVTSVECHRGHRGPTHADWFYRKSVAGGGVLLDLGIYQLTTVVWLFGPAQALTAMCQRRFDTRTLDDGTVVEPDVEDSAMLSLSLADRTAVSINANWNGYLSHHATRRRVTVIGRDGSLHFGVEDGKVYLHRADGEYDGLACASEDAQFDGYRCRRVAVDVDPAAATIVGDFVTRIEQGDTSLRPMQMQRHVTEIVLEAYRMSESGDGAEGVEAAGRPSMDGTRTLETRF